MDVSVARQGGEADLTLGMSSWSWDVVRVTQHWAESACPGAGLGFTSTGESQSPALDCGRRSWKAEPTARIQDWDLPDDSKVDLIFGDKSFTFRSVGQYAVLFGFSQLQ